MTVTTSIWLFQLVTAASLTLWMIVSVLNNLQGFRASMAAIGQTMGMTLLRDPPFDTLPFLKRAVCNPHVHRAALIGVVLAQGASALLLLAGTIALAGTPADVATGSGAMLLNLGLAAFILCWSSMFTAGLWFGYWIKQEGLLLTQLLLTGWGLASFLVFNLPVSAAAST